MKKRKDECLFCTSRRCSNRVVSLDDKGITYDEISCSKHADEMYKDSDIKAPKVMKMFISSTGRLFRKDMSAFDDYDREVKDGKTNII